MVINHDPVVLRVGDVQLPVLDPHALGTAHGFRRRRVIGRYARAGEIRLPHHYVGRLIVHGRDSVPDQNAVVVGIRNHDVDAVGGHRRRQPQTARVGGNVLGGGLKIRLPEHQICLAQAHRALAVVHQLRRRARQHGREALEKQNPMVGRCGAHVIGVSYEQRIGRVGNTAHPAQNRVARVRIRDGEGRLPNDQTGGLPIGESRGLAEHGGRK